MKISSKQLEVFDRNMDAITNWYDRNKEKLEENEEKILIDIIQRLARFGTGIYLRNGDPNLNCQCRVEEVEKPNE